MKKTDVLTILLMVFCSGHYYAITAQGSALTTWLLGGYCAVMCVWYLCSGKRMALTKKRCFVALGSLLAIICSAVWNQSFSIVDIKQMLLVVCALMIVSTYKWEVIRRQYIKVMDGILVLALLGFVLALTGLMSYFPTVTNYNGVTYHSAFLFSAITYPVSGITKRMHGLFWEPGLLASYVLIAMLLLERGNGKTGKKKYIAHMVFYSACVLLSSSGAGILLLPAVLIIKYLQGTGRKRRSKKLVALALIIVLALGVLALNIDEILQNEWLSTILISKIQNPEHANTSSRLNAVAIDLDIALSHLPFGIGISKYSTELQEYERYSSGTSTLTILIAQYGIPALVLVVMLLIGLYKLNRRTVWYVKAMSLLVFVAIFSKEPHNNLLFFNTLLMYAVGYRGVRYRAKGLRQIKRSHASIRE